MIATRELRRRQCLHTQELFTVTARRLAEFLESLEAQEVLLEQRLRDHEARRILAPTAGLAAESFEADDPCLRLKQASLFCRSGPWREVMVSPTSLRHITAREQITRSSKHGGQTK